MREAEDDERFLRRFGAGEEEEEEVVVVVAAGGGAEGGVGRVVAVESLSEDVAEVVEGSVVVYAHVEEGEEDEDEAEEGKRVWLNAGGGVNDAVVAVVVAQFDPPPAMRWTAPPTIFPTPVRTPSMLPRIRRWPSPIPRRKDSTRRPQSS